MSTKKKYVFCVEERIALDGTTFPDYTGIRGMTQK